MKKLIFVMAVLTAVAMVSPTVSFAQHEYDNQFGVFFDTVAEQINGAPTPSVPFFAYVMLLKPVDSVGGAVTGVEAIELMVTLVRTNPAETIFKLAETLPPGAINVGTATDMYDGLDYTVGLAEPVLVTNDAVILVTLQFMILDDAVPGLDPVELYMTNSRNGFLQYQRDGGPPLIPAFPSSGDQASPVASFNGGVVATESSTWGTVKSLYR